jgi:hypothetical protein
MLGLTYPYDWGFVPSTKGEDGDPIDVLVLHDAALGWKGPKTGESIRLRSNSRRAMANREVGRSAYEMSRFGRRGYRHVVETSVGRQSGRTKRRSTSRASKR